MAHIWFILIFIIVHPLAYIVAGVIALKISKDIYEGKGRLCTFLNDMKDEKERRHVEKFFLPAQLVRGLLMGAVLLPIFPALVSLSFGMRLLFFAALMFVYTHLSSASPFMDNIEGQVYFKKAFLMKKAFLKFQLEMVIYSVIFGTLVSVALALFF